MHHARVSGFCLSSSSRIVLTSNNSVAGSETTSVALRMTLLSLLTTPAAYRKVQAEIDAYFARTTPASDTGGSSVISYADVKTLTYLQAAIREAMRIWPPSAGLFTKEVPKNGDTLHGYYLPPGTEVGQSMMGVGRVASIWGLDAAIFRPERWLEADPDRLDEMQSAVDLVFSSGKYACLGKHVAMKELSKLLAEVRYYLLLYSHSSLEPGFVLITVVKMLRRYDVAIVNNAQPVKIRDPVVWLTTDFWITFTKREI